MVLVLQRCRADGAGTGGRDGVPFHRVSQGKSGGGRRDFKLEISNLKNGRKWEFERPSDQVKLGSGRAGRRPAGGCVRHIPGKQVNNLRCGRLPTGATGAWRAGNGPGLRLDSFRPVSKKPQSKSPIPPKTARKPKNFSKRLRGNELCRVLIYSRGEKEFVMETLI